jgi:hypothetical protein
VNSGYTATDCRVVFSSFNSTTAVLEVRWEMMNVRGVRFVKPILTSYSADTGKMIESSFSTSDTVNFSLK